MNFQVTIVGIGFARQQAFDALLFHALGNPLQGRHGILDQLFLTFCFGKLGKFNAVGKLGFGLTHTLNGRGQTRALAHQRLRLLGIVPEIRILREVLDFLEPYDGIVPVKDASGPGGDRIQWYLSVQ